MQTDALIIGGGDLWTVAAANGLTDRMLGAWGTPVRLTALFILALLLLSGLGFGLRTLWL